MKSIRLTRLHQLSPAQKGMVRGIEESPDRQRLMEVGLLPGVEVELVRQAPLGDPLHLRLGGFDLALRAAEAQKIWVEVLSDSNASSQKNAKQEVTSQKSKAHHNRPDRQPKHGKEHAV